MTWSEWKTLVANAYHTTAPNAMAVYRACAAYTKGEILRQVDRDIPLSKSYRNDYAAARVALAPYVHTANHATTLTAVQRLLTVDAARAAISSLISDCVQQAMDELAAGNTLYNSLLLESAVQLQRQVECLRDGHETYYLASDVGSQGAISIGQLPDGCSPQRMSLLPYAQDLAEGVAYDVDDRVASNQRIYVVVTAGTIGAGQLGAGLTSTDEDETETIDGVGFQYAGPVVDTPLHLVGWDKFRVLQQADPDGASDFLWAISDNARKFFVHPAVDADHRLCLEWNGVKLSFANDDTVPFDETCARATAEFIRAHLAAKFEESGQQAALAEERHKEAVRRVAADCLNRRAGG